MFAREIFDCADLHAGGEPLRLVLGGYPPLPRGSVLDVRRYLETDLDGYRRLLMAEPWGHADMYGCLLTEAERPDSVAGAVFMHNGGYPTISAHALIALATYLAETGRIPPGGDGRFSMKIDVPSGQIAAHAFSDGRRVTGVRLEGIPAFPVSLDHTVRLQGRDIRLDVSYGGAFYAIVPAAAVGRGVEAEDVDALMGYAAELAALLGAEGLTHHPHDGRLDGLAGVTFTGLAHDAAHHSRNVTVLAGGQVDRSPSGSALAARMAALLRRGDIVPGEWVAVEGVLDTVFRGAVLEPSDSVGPFAAYSTAIEGEAHLTGFRRFYRDVRDPIPPFLIR